MTICRVSVLGCLLFGSASAHAQSNYATPYAFTTLAGLAWEGPGNSGSADGAGNAARFNCPSSVAVDGSGNVYVADSGSFTIRKITPAGAATTFAGSAGAAGSMDGIGPVARFGSLGGIAVDGAGNVYVTDSGNDTIRKVTPAGMVTTLAGQAGNAGIVDGIGTAARFGAPCGLAADASGNVYVADGCNRIRRITPAGVVTTFAGGTTGGADGTGAAAQFNGVSGVAVDGAGNVYVADCGNHTVRKITQAGSVTTLAGTALQHGISDGAGPAARFYSPQDVAVDAAGNVYVADTANNMIRKVSPAGVVTALAGPGSPVETPHGTDCGAADGIGAAAQFNHPTGVAVDASGNVYVADDWNRMIRKITPEGAVTTLAGPPPSFGGMDGTGVAARLDGPADVAVDGSGNVYVADQFGNTVRKITAGGLVTTLAGLANAAGSDDGAGSAARFNWPAGVAVDGSGNVYVADLGNNTIRKITAEGVVTTVAGLAGASGGADGAGSAARFNGPSGVASDASGNIYVADAYNHTIRKITPAGAVTTLAGQAGVQGSADGTGAAARFMTPWSVATDAAGNIVVADSDSSTIRRITPAGAVTTLAGLAGVQGSADGTGTDARFGSPVGVAVDVSGNVYVVDELPGAIRLVTPAGAVTTLAGGGTDGSEDGAGSSVHFFLPGGVAVDGAGRVHVADFGNNTIRAGERVVPAAPAFTRQPQSQSTTAGGSASFVVAASGWPVFQWQQSADGGASWSDLSYDGIHLGATTPTLTVRGATLAMNGCRYRCVVRTSVGPATSDPATLVVLSAGDSAFLQEVFLGVLGRNPAVGELAIYGGALASGRTRAEVLGDLMGSTEYAGRGIDPAIRLYFAALARMPDYDGLQNWSNALHAGALTLTGAADQFASSPEFQLRYGTLDNTQYVKQLYRNVLGREADTAGLADWVGQLDRGTSRGSVLVGFSESEEFKGNLSDQVEILRLYFLLLRRMPTTAELESWTGFLMGYDQTDSLYMHAYPSGLTGAAYVQAVFKGFLRRDAAAGEQSAFGGALTAGALTHGSLVETVMNSAEFNLFVAPVSRLYLAALRRVPDQPGLDNWVNFVRAGASLQVMADAFASSEEFLSRYGAMNNQQYVTQLYHDVLGRDADPDGLAHWTGLLDRGGTTRGQILIGFSESQEAVHLFAPTVRTFLHYFTFLGAAPTQQELDYWKNYLATLTAQFREAFLRDMGAGN